ncbi:pseudouridine synthase [Acholeplasma granularum]|uniref:pseudouridine synthase n=1 Tax=Acholeplasma granularum TaxID=264635 RepID=UPI0004AF7EEF|nr:pseudouridine synthase [Acholeplasma granularum]
MFAKQYKKYHKPSNDLIDQEFKETLRLNLYISKTGVSSRRGADTLIEHGRIKVNGKVATVGMQINKTDIVTLDNKEIRPLKEKVYILLNKPKGIVSTTDTAISGNMITYMNYPEKIFPIGRLDKDSTGLILLTNDGSIVNKILRVENGHDKEYLVTLNKPYDEYFTKALESGVTIYNPVLHKNQKTLPSKLEVVDEYSFKLTIKQGLNRQIRRMADSLGYKVIELKRIRIMHILLDNLPEGYWRYLTENELLTLNDKISN